MPVFVDHFIAAPIADRIINNVGHEIPEDGKQQDEPQIKIAELRRERARGSDGRPFGKHREEQDKIPVCDDPMERLFECHSFIVAKYGRYACMRYNIFMGRTDTQTKLDFTAPEILDVLRSRIGTKLFMGSAISHFQAEPVMHGADGKL